MDRTRGNPTGCSSMNNKIKNCGNKFENIIFFEDDKTPLIRPINPKQKDFDALARCYNSFKDSDSWPGGFGGSFVFTGEYLEERLTGQDLTSQFIIVAPDDSEKIVGVSICSRTWNLPDAWYVQLIGVDPKYQGQKFGKALLLQSTKFAMEKNARFISLHTWGGNLKAMPLYKRQGYKWRPNTSVYMENYIPQILGYPYFNSLFTQYSWYDSFKPNINQVPDEEFDNKMHVYEYYFEMDQNHSIKTWIDRTIGRISGFHYKTTEDDLYIRAQTPNSEAFIGIEEFPVALTLRNNGNKPKEVIIKTNASTKIELSSEFEQVITLKAGDEKIIQLSASLALDTEELDLKVFTHAYSEQQITFTIKCDEIKFPISVGKVPLNAIKILTHPLNYSTIPNQKLSIPLELTNCLGEEKEVILEVANSKNITFEKNTFTINVSPYDSSIELPAKIGETNTTVDYIEVLARTKDDEILHKTKLPIPLFNENKTIVYYFEDQIFIENKYLRLNCYKKPTPGSNEISIKDKLRDLRVNGNTLLLGYPFDEEGSEFLSKKLEHEVIETDTGIWLYSTAESDQKPGVKVTRKVYIPHANEPFGIQFSVENLLDEAYDNLGILTGTYWWPGQHPSTGYVLPYKDGIARGSLHEIQSPLEKNPSELSEGWKATEYVSGTLGYLFDLNKIDKINISRRFPAIEYRLPELKAKTSYNSPMTWYCFADSWQQIRKYWLDKYYPSPKNELEFYLEAKPDKQFGLQLTKDDSDISRGLILSNNQKNVNIAFKTIGKAAMKGSVKVETKKKIITDSGTTIDDPKVSSWLKKISIKSTESKIINGNITYDCFTRKYQTPIALAFYDKKKEISITKRKQASKEYFEVDNGFLRFRGSKDHRGHIYYLAVEDSDENYFHTFFPEIKSFMWFNEFHGGIGGIIYPFGFHLGEEEFYNKLTFDMFEVRNGQWKGIGVKTSIIDYTPRLKGLQMTLNCLTLPDAPFILVQQKITNHSNVPRTCNIDMGTSLNVSKSSKDQYYFPSVNGEIITLSMHEYESRSWMDKKKYNKWTAFKKADNKYFIGLVSMSSKYASDVYTYSPNLTFSRVGRDITKLTIQPEETITLYDLFLITDDLASIEPFTQNNILDLLEEK